MINAGLERRVAPWLFFLAGLLMCWLHNPTTLGFYQDNQIYVYVAERVAAGSPPHISLVDHKHALSSILSGWAVWLARLVDANEIFVARMLSITLAAATVAGVWRLVVVLSGSTLAAHLAGLVMLNFVDFFMQATIGYRPKVFMAFFMVWALLHFARGRDVRGGACAIASFLCWQPALLVWGSLLGAAAFDDSRRLRIARLAAGGLLVLFAYEAYFAWHGALGEQLYQSYVMPAAVSQQAIKSLVSTYQFLIRLGLPRSDASYLYVHLYFAALGLAWGWVAMRPRDAWRQARTRPDRLAVLACATATLSFTVVEHQGYPDLFFIHSYIAISCGIAAASAIEILARLVPPWRKSITVVATVACIYFTVSLAVDRLETFPSRHGKHLYRQMALANEVDMLREQYGAVWAVGCPHLLALLHLENHVSYGLLLDPKLRTYLKRETRGEVYRPLRNGEMPGVILLSRAGERDVLSWLTAEYEQIPMPRFKIEGIRVWIRR